MRSSRLTSSGSMKHSVKVNRLLVLPCSWSKAARQGIRMTPGGRTFQVLSCIWE